MTFPITPLPAIHNDPFDAALARQELLQTLSALEKMFGQLAHDILIGVINAILQALGLGPLEGPVHALVNGLGAGVGQLVHGIISALSGSGSGISGIISALEAIPYANLKAILGTANLGQDVQAIVDHIANALGFAGTGHTLTNLLTYLTQIPFANITAILGSAHLGADVQAIVDKLANGLGFTGTGHTLANLLTYIGQIPQANVVGLSTIATNAANAISELTSLISGVAGSTITDVVNLLLKIQQIIDTLLNALGFSGSGFSIPQLLSNVEGALSGLLPGVVSNLDGTGSILSGLITLNGDGTGTFSQVLGGVNSLIAGGDGTLMSLESAVRNAALSDNLTRAVGNVQQTIDNVANTLGAGLTGAVNPASAVGSGLENIFGLSFPESFPSTFGPSSDTGAVSLPATVHEFQQLLDGIANVGNVGVPTFGNTIQDAVSSLENLRHAIHSDISQAVQDGAAQVVNGSAIAQTLQAFPGGNVISGISNAGATVVEDAQAIVDAGVRALNPTSGGIGNTIHAWESALSSHLTGLFNGLTGASVPVAGATDVSAAALAATEAAASLAGQTAAISAQLPHFYGGSGSSGMFADIGFLRDGTFPAGWTVNPTSGLYTAQSADTDSQTVSGIWSTPMVPGIQRGLFLRSNTAQSTYVYALWEVVGDPGASAQGAYYIPNNTAAYFTIQLGCSVAGVVTPLHNFGPYPLWSFAGNVIIESYTPIEVGPWWHRQVQYSPNYGPGYNAATGYPMHLASSNNTISLEVTDYSITLDYPSLGPCNVNDSGHISQIGSSYRSAGFIDNAGAPASMLSWAFYDSGPTAGPSDALVVTPESTTSTSFTNLPTTTDQVTINVGASGLVILFISALMSNATVGDGCKVAVAMSGANVATASQVYGLMYQSSSTSSVDQRGAAFLLSLNPGPTTFKLEYASLLGGAAIFEFRAIAAIPL